MMSEAGKHGRSRDHSWRLPVWSGAIVLLLLPLIAMQFTSEVDWGPLDFVVFGTLLLVACGCYELAARLMPNRAYRAATAIALVAAFLLVWINLAVGVIGSEQNPANAMYAAVLAVGAIVAIVMRFAPQGMALAMIGTAIAQVAVAVIAIVLEFGRATAGWPLDIALLTTFFTVLWVGAALLYRSAARTHDHAEATE